MGHRVLETRSADLEASVGDGKLVGRSIVFGKDSVDMGGWVEQIMPGSLEFDSDLYLDYDHDSKYILGRSSNGTLAVTIDSEGVSFEATPPDTSFVEDLRTMMRGGYVGGCSFGFWCDEAEWMTRESDGMAVRQIKRAHVFSLTITGIPAYPDTGSEARSAAGYREYIESRDADGGEPGDGSGNIGATDDPRGGEDEETFIAGPFGAVKITEE